MRVKELIKALEKLDGDALVYTEGCDCEGLAGEPTVNGGTVTVTRLPDCSCEPSIYLEADDIGQVQDKCEDPRSCGCKRCHPPGSVFP